VDVEVLVGGVLVAGLVVFLVGAVRWRLSYERPAEESLPGIHQDRRRRAWIHAWMIAGVVLTTAGLAGLTRALEQADAAVLAAIGATVYACGATGFLVSLAFRLGVVPWAAERTARTGSVPDGFAAFDRWAAVLYVVHMLTAYVGSAVLGAAVLLADAVPTWLGWAGIVWGMGFAAGLVATRFAGAFNPPFWAHLYTAAVGVALLLG
jgi:hypothetical protein